MLKVEMSSKRNHGGVKLVIKIKPFIKSNGPVKKFHFEKHQCGRHAGIFIFSISNTKENGT